MSSKETRQKSLTKPRASTGVPGLDDVLSGGLPGGHLYLFEGDPGAGKTTIGLQFLMHGVAQGERVLYVTLSESKAELEEGAESHGWSLQGIEIHEFAPTEESLRPEDQYSHFHPSEVEFQDTTQHILEKIKALEPKRVVFDSLEEEEKGTLRDLQLIGAAQRVEHYEVAAYGTARAMAEKLDMAQAAELLGETLAEEEQADTKLTEVAGGLYGEVETQGGGGENGSFQSSRLYGFLSGPFEPRVTRACSH